MKKVRKQIMLDPEQEKRLEEESTRTGASQGEIVRRALDGYLGGMLKKAFNAGMDSCADYERGSGQLESFEDWYNREVL